MKKVVLASLLACVVIALGVTSTLAQTPVQLGSQTNKVQMPDAEYTVYSNAINQSNPQAKAAGLEGYLTAYPKSAVKLDVLVALLTTYSQFDGTGVKVIDAADRVLALDPENLRALTFEAYFRKAAADALSDNAAKQAGLNAAAGFAQKGLAATKPIDITDADFKTLQTAAYPIFYSTIGEAALTKADYATAIDTYKKELAFVPLAQTESPNGQLPDTYQLGFAYMKSTPPDLLSCSFYMSRVVAYAPDAVKSQYAPLAKWCYKKYHDGEDGYETIAAAAKDNLFPPTDLFASIKPGLTPAQKIHNFISTTPDLATLAIDDKEMVFQFGSQDDSAKVWDAIKGKSVQLPGAVVVESSPTVLKVAISNDSVANKTADFVFNLTPPETIPEPADNATLAQKTAYKKAVAEAAKKAEEIAAATTVGKTVTLTGTYDSFTTNPVQIIMKDGEVILAKAAKPAPTAAHHPAAAHHAH